MGNSAAKGHWKKYGPFMQLYVFLALNISETQKYLGAQEYRWIGIGTYVCGPVFVPLHILNVLKCILLFHDLSLERYTAI